MISLEEIVSTVSAYKNVPVEIVVSPTHENHIADCRHIISKIAKEVGYSLNQTGKILGKRNHSTIHKGIKKAEALIETDKYFRNDYLQIVKVIDDKQGI